MSKKALLCFGKPLQGKKACKKHPETFNPFSFEKASEPSPLLCSPPSVLPQNRNSQKNRCDSENSHENQLFRLWICQLCAVSCAMHTFIRLESPQDTLRLGCDSESLRFIWPTAIFRSQSNQGFVHTRVQRRV